MPPERRDPMERFLRYVEFSPRRDDGTYCLLWTGGLFKTGYGQFWDGDRTVKAHIWLYQRWVGEVPEGRMLHHHCHNRPCVNPLHLEPVTPKEHGEAHQATECLRGHPYDEENTYVDSRGWQHCRTCSRVRQREAYRRKVSHPDGKMSEEATNHERQVQP